MDDPSRANTEIPILYASGDVRRASSPAIPNDAFKRRLKKIIGCAFVGKWIFLGTALAQPLCPPSIEWQRGRAGDSGTYFRQFKPLENGYVLGGYSYAGTNEHKTSPSYGFGDFHLVRLDTNFNQLWDRSFGGTNADYSCALQQTAAGGFILGGDSWSPPSGNKTSAHYGSSDFWVVGTDADGVKIWDESFGGTDIDTFADLHQTADGGLICGGYSRSGATGNKTSPNYGGNDFWVVRVDPSGNMLWDRSFGGSQEDRLSSLQQTSDGGFILGGFSQSDVGGNKTSPHFGEWDYWIIRLDADGNKLWERTFGGAADDTLSQVQQTIDGGFILIGWSTSWPSGNKTSPHYGSGDFWIVRLDANGNKLWEQSAGGNYAEGANSLIQMADGGWLVGGASYSPPGGTKTSLGYGYADYWLVRLSASGALLWDQSFGGSDNDNLQSIHRTADGGVLVFGQSDSPVSGNKTVPLLAYPALWLLKLGLETVGDCDGDGVPDVRDLCPNTPPGTLVTTNGCGIVQLCPCQGAWESNREYVQCVSRVTTELLAEGVIDEPQRSNLIARAVAAGCPFGSPADAVLIFGLTNAPIGRATLSSDASGSEESGSLKISNFGREGQDGVTVRLGEADSGLFIYPDAPIWGVYSDAWFAEEKAFGRINGDTHSLIATIRGTKPDYEIYPVTVDLSPLQPSSLTFLIFSNRALIAQATIPGARGDVVIQSSDYLGPRVNPFWRMPDGSIGAIIEFSAPLPEGSEEYGRNSISGPFGSDIRGDRIFIRADNPSNRVDYISRVDVTGFLESYQHLLFREERLGVFQRAHKALGPAVLDAADGQLTLRRTRQTSDDFIGVLIETKEAKRFDVILAPLDFGTNEARCQLFGTALNQDGPDLFAYAELNNSHGVLELFAQFPPPDSGGTNAFANPSPPLLQVKVYNNGSLAGVSTATNGSIVGTLSLPGRTQVPQLIGCGVDIGSSNAPPYIAITLRGRAIFNGVDGTEFRGNHLRIVAPGPLMPMQELESFTLGVVHLPSFSITGERSGLVSPALNIASLTNTLLLTWPSLNLPFVLEATTSLPASFSIVTNDVEFIDNQNRVLLPRDPTANRFLRLHLSPE